MGVHSYGGEQGGCIRNIGFFREKNKMRTQPRGFWPAPCPLIQSDSSWLASVAIFAPSSLPLLYLLLLQEGRILLCEMHRQLRLNTTPS